jgi:hypothetical protein
MPPKNVNFEVDRKDFSKTRTATQDELPALTSGQVRLRIDRFALTANNISYALTGDQLDYWRFFPTGEPWGRIPAMGWADVTESAHADVAVGGRYYGWYPMSGYVTIDARVVSGGVVDEASHRASHAPIYRSYRAADLDPLYDADHEDEHALLRGLFATAFLADDFFFDHDFFAAKTTVVLSASSKTAIGFAFQSKARDRGPVVGVTSAKNQAFVEALDCYDQVALYDDVEAIPNADDAVLVDMAGNPDVLRRVHAHLGGKLRYSMSIGASHWDAKRTPQEIVGPTPEFFFAPTQAAKRMQEWGPGGYEERVAEALGRFVKSSGDWLEIVRCYGPTATATTYQALLAGKIPPSLGQIVSLHDESA